MFLVVTLLLSCTFLEAADRFWLKDQVSLEEMALLVELGDIKSGDPVARKIAKDTWIHGTFVSKFGNDETALVAIKDKDGHGSLVPIKYVRSFKS
jgi:hypothetical protein